MIPGPLRFADKGLLITVAFVVIRVTRLFSPDPRGADSPAYNRRQRGLSQHHPWRFGNAVGLVFIRW